MINDSIFEIDFLVFLFKWTKSTHNVPAKWESLHNLTESWICDRRDFAALKFTAFVCQL